MNDINKLAQDLAEVTDRLIPVSQLEALTDKQRWYLGALCENILNPNTYAFYWKPKTESLVIIKDILKIKAYLDKKDSYLKMKFNN